MSFEYFISIIYLTFYLSISPVTIVCPSDQHYKVSGLTLVTWSLEILALWVSPSVADGQASVSRSGDDSHNPRAPLAVAALNQGVTQPPGRLRQLTLVSMMGGASWMQPHAIFGLDFGDLRQREGLHNEKIEGKDGSDENSESGHGGLKGWSWRRGGWCWWIMWLGVRVVVVSSEKGGGNAGTARIYVHGPWPC